jgi:hypothetical protein
VLSDFAFSTPVVRVVVPRTRRYGLFKQSTKGGIGAAAKRPGALDPVARAKHDAWADYEVRHAENRPMPSSLFLYATAQPR